MQFVVGLWIDEKENTAIITFGEMDRRMKLARLPLDRCHDQASVALQTLSLSLLLKLILSLTPTALYPEL